MPRTRSTGEEDHGTAAAAPAHAAAEVTANRRRGGGGARGGRSRRGGRGGAAGASSSEPRDAIRLLEQQHRSIALLFAELATDTQGRDLRPVMLELADQLSLHGAIEERLFYPVVRDEDTEVLLDDAYEDHHDMKELLLEMMDVGVDDPSFPARVSELKGLVDEHVAIEEAELFPMAREQLDASQLEAIAREMTVVMAELQQEGPPREQLLAEGPDGDEEGRAPDRR
jgi:hypothetical protein